MLLGPIFRVEMTAVARRRRYFLLRVVYGFLALFLLWTAYSSLRYMAYGYGSQQGISIRQGAQLAASFFVSFIWLQTLAILGIGPALAVGTIASERERRTIEYLFTTDLSNAEIIFGKLTARLCLLGQLILVGLPILFLFRLLGGIPARLLLVTFVFATSTSLLIASLSICVSVWSERARDATIRVYVFLAAFLFLPPILSSLGSIPNVQGPAWNTFAKPILDFCMLLNPMTNLAQAIGNTSAIGSSLDMQLFWQTVGYQCLVSVAALALATFAVRRVHLKETTKAATRQSRRRRWRIPTWRRPLKSDAMLWKEVFASTAVNKLGLVGSIAIALILLTICGFTIFGLTETLREGHRERHREGFIRYLYTLNAIVGTGVLLLLAARAAGLVTSEKERDCWLSLIATPLTGHDIIRGKLWGNLYSVRWPLVILAAHWCLGIFFFPSFWITAVANLGTFLLLAWYVTTLGLTFSLNSQTTLRAMGATLGTLIFTGGGYLFCCCVVMSVGGSGGDEMLIILAPCIPFHLFFPGLAFTEWSNNFNSIEESMTAAYVFGIFAYLVAAATLYINLIKNFDPPAGRTKNVPEQIA